MWKLVALFSIALAALCILPHSVTAQPAWTPPRAGVWKVSGRDDDGVRWRAGFTITKRVRVGRNYEIRGVFRWSSKDVEDSGREYVNGTFYPASGKLSLRGYAVKSERGEIMKTIYSGRVSDLGKLISKGRWFGKDVVNGTWRAEWQKSK